jgi:hypothetical protein
LQKKILIVPQVAHKLQKRNIMLGYFSLIIEKMIALAHLALQH